MFEIFPRRGVRELTLLSANTVAPDAKHTCVISQGLEGKVQFFLPLPLQISAGGFDSGCVRLAIGATYYLELAAFFSQLLSTERVNSLRRWRGVKGLFYNQRLTIPDVCASTAALVFYDYFLVLVTRCGDRAHHLLSSSRKMPERRYSITKLRLREV